MDRYLIDSHKLMYHPSRVAELVDAKADWEKHKNLKPIYAEISSSGACNHRCTFCSVDYIGYKPIFLERETLRSFFESAREIGLKSVMFAGDGEPLLNKDIIGIVEDANTYGIDTSFTTNGVHLTEEFCDSSLDKVSWIKVSMNAGSGAVYKSVHRTSEKDFLKVWKGLEYAVNVREKNTANKRRRTALGVQSLILPENLGSLDELAARAEGCGLDYLVLKPYVHNVYMEQEGYQGIDYTIKEYNETIQQLKNKYDAAKFKVIARTNALNKLVGNTERYEKCWSTPALWFYISGDGSVYSCGAHVGKEEFYLGNIKEQAIRDIWSSERRKSCLEFVQNELDLSVCRRTCRMDEANAYLSNLIGGDVEHVNFI